MRAHGRAVVGTPTIPPLAYAHYRLQADDRDKAGNNLREALRHLRQMQQGTPASGYCVELWHPGLLIPQINKVFDRGPARVTTAAAVDIVWKVITTIQNTLNFGDLQLRIRGAPGTADVLSAAGRNYMNGNSPRRR